MPYNYILDRNLIKQNEVFLEDSIIIFDEGHNVASAAAQGMSLTLRTSRFAQIIYSLKKAKNLDKKHHQDKDKPKR